MYDKLFAQHIYELFLLHYDFIIKQNDQKINEYRRLKGGCLNIGRLLQIKKGPIQSEDRIGILLDLQLIWI
jgi:hypothetical protein